ncbi:alkylhydroperoxidase domain protein [Pectobacterium parmentieri]|uniref:alkylhydroperoxidase domain protein n=1 Tax=Pectobacterium parmentieri TaxID=1905730 RepID=UPI000CDCE76C|nr:alkylhydroperoxidase domain protein [Pectobacterium parmentieri]AYH07869.1 alkylhydroperoxidase domain protein [Pectobacterium parmentieri]AYH16621.1 alkylhydroperoxidase domain protein [Pectobacterium parmentieri]AYH25320.1 alkylhydroperoxidase domain protein [Pectobacterium parmentieri]AYH34209.1 alkylhydroperoxidase domain protein [Pectobacterium parmentieri]MBN3177460.1 alkylhydroperoxidase domain protein [Pectobacterium parmentieri]
MTHANTLHTHDVLDALADISPDSTLAEARKTREAATRHTQGSYDALFNAAAHDNATLPLSLRFWFATKISGWQQDEQLQHFYAERLADFPEPTLTPALQLALDHAERLTKTPVQAAPSHVNMLEQTGWSVDDIVTLSQLIAFVNFQSRLLRGYRLIAGHRVSQPHSQAAVAGQWNIQQQTYSGKSAPQTFTQAELSWEPWIASKPLATFNADEQAILARFGHTDSDYFRLLGRNLPVLEQRTLTDKGIFYTSGGLPRKERELIAAVTSKVNGCIYCASVHARKASQLSKQDSDVQRLLDVVPGGDLGIGQSPRWQAIIDFSARLSATPAQVNANDLKQLQGQGLDTLEIVDVVQSAAFFSWANRLMLTLGEPFWPEH